MWTSKMRSHWDRMRYFKYEIKTWSHWFLTWILNDFSIKISLDISSTSQFYLRIFSTTNIKIIWESQLRSDWIHNDISSSPQPHCFQGVEILNWDIFSNNIYIMFDLYLFCLFIVPFTKPLYYYVVSK